MNQEKEIKKLMKKANQINNEDIDDFEKTKFIDMPLEGFLEVSGELYFHEEQGAFYKNNGEIWYRFKQGSPVEMKGLTKEEARIVWDPAIMDRILRIEAWTRDFKRYVDESFNYYESKVKEIEKVQSEAITELQAYTDLKIKQLETAMNKAMS